jgi:hypothetical protein
MHPSMFVGVFMPSCSCGFCFVDVMEMTVGAGGFDVSGPLAAVVLGCAVERPTD